MKNRLKLLLITALLSLIPSHASLATDKVSLASVYIPLMIEKDGTGLFIKLADEIARRAGIVFDYDVLPALRAVSIYKAGKVDAVFPATSRSSDILGSRSAAIYIRRDYAFVREGSPLPRQIQDLEGLSVIINPNYDHNKLLLNNPKITLVKGRNDVSSMKMLARGRGEALVVEARSGMEAMKQAGVGNLVFDPKNPITSVDAFFVFKPGERGKDLAKRVSKAIKEIVEDGTYKSMFGVDRP